MTWDHGTAEQFIYGKCRCLACRVAHHEPTEVVGGYNFQTPTHKHGTHHRYGTGCRCGACTSAHATYKREARARAPKPVSDPRRCEHCGERFPTKKERGQHVAEAHPFSRQAPLTSPPPDVTTVELHGDRWSAA